MNHALTVSESYIHQIRLIIMAIIVVMGTGFGCTRGGNPQGNQEKGEQETKAAYPGPFERPCNVRPDSETAPFASPIISTQQAGQVVIGQPLRRVSPEFPHRFEMRTRVVSREGDEYRIVSFALLQDHPDAEGEGCHTELLHITVSENFAEGEDEHDRGEDFYQNIPIREIKILSPVFRTREGIVVNSTITEFMGEYPSGTIWYTYVSDRTVMESNTPDLRNVQFMLSRDDYIGPESKIDCHSDLCTLAAEDFREDAPIISVRLYPI